MEEGDKTNKDDIDDENRKNSSEEESIVSDPNKNNLKPDKRTKINVNKEIKGNMKDPKERKCKFIYQQNQLKESDTDLYDVNEKTSKIDPNKERKFIEVEFKNGRQFNKAPAMIKKKRNINVSSTSTFINGHDQLVKQTDLPGCYKKNHQKMQDKIERNMRNSRVPKDEIIIKPLTGLDCVFIEVNKEAKLMGGFDSPPPEIIVVKDPLIIYKEERKESLPNQRYNVSASTVSSNSDFYNNNNKFMSPEKRQRGRPPKKPVDMSSDHSDVDDYLFPPRVDKKGNSFFVCPQEDCAKEFPSLSRVKRHYIVHTGKKPYKCLNKDCDKRFSRRDNMMQHYRAHCSVTKSKDKNR